MFLLFRDQLVAPGTTPCNRKMNPATLGNYSSADGSRERLFVPTPSKAGGLLSAGDASPPCEMLCLELLITQSNLLERLLPRPSRCKRRSNSSEAHTRLPATACQSASSSAYVAKSGFAWLDAQYTDERRTLTANEKAPKSSFACKKASRLAANGSFFDTRERKKNSSLLTPPKSPGSRGEGQAVEGPR